MFIKEFSEEDTIKDITDTGRTVFLYGAGTGGSSYSRITLAALINLGGKPECFLDDDCDKISVRIDNFIVNHINFLKKYRYKKITVVISSNYIAPMLEKIESFGIKDIRILSCAPLLRLASSSAYIDIMEYEEVLRRASTHEEKLLSKFSDEKPLINIIDLQITEKCTMKCKDCSNLMQYYDKPVHIGIKEIVESFTKLSKCVDVFKEVRVLGGEPFFNKDLYKIVNFLTGLKNVEKVAIITNATIVPKDHVLHELQHDKVFLDITNYGDLSKNHEKLISILKDKEIKYITHKPQEWTDSGRIVKNNLNNNQLAQAFSKCCVNDVVTLLHGKLYHCPFSANAYNLNAILNKKSDSINISEYNNINKLRIDLKNFYFGRPFLEACKYCLGRDFSQSYIKPAIQTKKVLPIPLFNGT